MVQPSPQYPRPQPKKSGNGCLIAMAIFGGIVLVVCLGAGIGIYKVASSKEGKQILSIVGEGAKIALDAQKAPGTKELKQIGCKQPMVMSMDRLMKLTEQMTDAGSMPAGELSMIVMCPVGMLDKPPSCEDVANTYVSAAPPMLGQLIVNVTVQGKTQPHCNTIHAPDGKRLGNADDIAIAMPPAPSAGE